MRPQSLALLMLSLAAGCGGLAERDPRDDPGTASIACEPGTTRSQSCGKNGRGQLAQTCVSGSWSVGTCADPDECTDGAVTPTWCIGADNALISCFQGQWQEGVCSDSGSYQVSVDSSGQPANDRSYVPSLSADGRFVAFHSYADNLVADDSNGATDIFVHDAADGTTQLVSVSSAGTQGNAQSFFPNISADGRYVAFESEASNLVAGDTNATTDIFVRDLWVGSTERISVDSSGNQGNGASTRPSISADGRFVAFESDATNLSGTDVGPEFDVFVHDRESGSTRLLSAHTAAGTSFDAKISADGHHVAFASSAVDLVPGDTNGHTDIFVYDLVADTTLRVSVGNGTDQTNGDSFEPAISADGRFVAFRSSANNVAPPDQNSMVDVFLRDLQDGSTLIVSTSEDGSSGNFGSLEPSISADGRLVAFHSYATNLVSGDTNEHSDVFVRDVSSGRIRCVSVSSSGDPGDGDSEQPSLSADGRYVAFQSSAGNLGSGPGGYVTGVFLAPTD